MFWFELGFDIFIFWGLFLKEMCEYLYIFGVNLILGKNLFIFVLWISNILYYIERREFLYNGGIFDREMKVKWMYG